MTQKLTRMRPRQITGTAVYRFRNSDSSTVDTVLSSELELIGVFQDAALGTVDFV